MQMVFRVVDSFDLKILNNYLSAGCKVINTVNMPFVMGVIQKEKTSTTVVHGGWTDYILEVSKEQRKAIHEGTALLPSAKSN